MFIIEYLNMYHPSKYKIHNESLQRFVGRFNKEGDKIKSEISIEIYKHENFMDDAIIIDKKTKKKLSFDWERRDRYYKACGFPFKDFGQFERKIKKPEIILSIQCCQSEKCFCIAWHEDLKKEEIKKIGSVTESGEKEFTGKRFTDKFLELNYNEMVKLHIIFRKAFDLSLFNFESFK